MKTILFITLMTLSIMTQAQSWHAESTEYQSQQKVDNTKPDKMQTSIGPQTKSAISRPQYHGTEEFWVYDAWVTLEGDQDHDGYYSDFTLNFDVDTYYTSAAVYAVLYLGVDDEFREYHSSSVFTIYDEDSDDAFEVNTTLVEGFVSEDYEILIEVYDADSNNLVAVYDGYTDSDLLYLPLESVDYEYTEPQVIVNSEGGTNSISTIIALLTLAGWRRIRSVN
ncbi:choice-of-anchor H family protein [Lacimicrobium alkaliphilum]|uniref:GlyGly-CTERM sorting domain-containing protein n=1 Tax=Lacimicrobium alkaliphilum TaxID=1526571 RepID=A0A0U3B9E0_9ALTE|nr:choice-of-anchor H family protein [Lacimicrobium alkaliphilum]ALT00170.1 hypothetical protein AT746_19140 [Lacimicrobium alkaliphilum]